MMGIARIFFTPIDYRALLTIIDAYFQSSHIPDMFPEHSPTRYPNILSKMRETFLVLSYMETTSALPMTDPEVAALDTAVEGYIRICERLTVPSSRRDAAIQRLREFREELEELKTPAIH